MEWQSDGSVGFRANNGKFVATKKSGHLYANAEAPEETSKFFFYLINRSVVGLDSSAHRRRRQNLLRSVRRTVIRV